MLCLFCFHLPSSGCYLFDIEIILYLTLFTLYYNYMLLNTFIAMLTDCRVKVGLVLSALPDITLWACEPQVWDIEMNRHILAAGRVRYSVAFTVFVVYAGFRVFKGLWLKKRNLFVWKCTHKDWLLRLERRPTVHCSFCCVGCVGGLLALFKQCLSIDF